jgi:hypothetical protein
MSSGAGFLLAGSTDSDGLDEERAARSEKREFVVAACGNITTISEKFFGRNVATKLAERNELRSGLM